MLVAALGLTVLGASGVGIFYLTDRDGWNKRKYDRIQTGITREELLSVLGEQPDCVVAIGRSEAWFYRGALGAVPCPSHVDQPAELPTLYGTLQILLGPDGRVRAVAMDGERSTKIPNGTLFASTLQLLPMSEVQ
jgi:hypothetical protein